MPLFLLVVHQFQPRLLHHFHLQVVKARLQVGLLLPLQVLVQVSLLREVLVLQDRKVLVALVVPQPQLAHRLQEVLVNQSLSRLLVVNLHQEVQVLVQVVLRPHPLHQVTVLHFLLAVVRVLVHPLLLVVVLLVVPHHLRQKVSPKVHLPLKVNQQVLALLQVRVKVHLLL